MNMNINRRRGYFSGPIKLKKKKPGVYDKVSCRLCGCIDKPLRKCSDGLYICEDCMGKK
jgi:hypothetical protein